MKARLPDFLPALLIVAALLVPVVMPNFSPVVVTFAESVATPLATFSLPYDSSLMMLYPDLTEPQKQLFDVIYQGVMAGQTSVALPEKSLYDDVTVVTKVIREDCPELCMLTNACTITYGRNAPEYALTVEPEYYPNTTPAMVEEVLNAARSIVQGATGGEYERELYLHDYLCANVAYDADADMVYTAYGAIIDGAAVCEGYTKAMMLLCRLSGLRCGMIVGTARSEDGESGRHSWNYVQVDGVDTLVDVTWDDGAKETQSTHWYVNLTTAQMGLDHFPEDGDAPLCTDDSANWHVRQGRMVRGDEAEAKAVFQEALACMLKTGESVNLRFADAEVYQTALSAVNAWILDFNESHADKERFYGEYTMFVQNVQLCLMICQSET